MPDSSEDLFVVDEGRNKSEAPLAHPSPARTAAYYRNLYKERLDFRTLAAEDEEFAQFTRHGNVNFRDPAAVMQLTKTLLRRDFNLEMELPSDRLCPPVPNRHAYVQWISALLETTGLDRQVVGADVGTGASCIYPLLACAQHADWQFVATDIDEKSLGYARANVGRNSLQNRIKVVRRTTEDTLVPIEQAGGSHGVTNGLPQTLSFVMMNPPFYSSAAEMEASASAKEQPPHTACTGAPVEMVYDGQGGDDSGSDAQGEVAFVGRMMTESLQLGGRVGWYTAMVGKLSSLVTLVERLRSPEVGVDNYAVAAFVTGSKTRRWALGWSYGARRPTVDVARGFLGAESTLSTGFDSCRHILPPITEVDVWSIPAAASLGSRGGSSRPSVSGISETVDTALQGLELLSWEWDARTLQGAGRARENVWGRAWRRKKMREAAAAAAAAGTSPLDIRSTVSTAATSAADTECAFGFEVKVRVGVAETTVGCRWLEGHSEVIYQSFCGFLKTKLKEAQSTAESSKA
ncbi:hypothetical protein F503_06025 [Ophiostoma piceae UAMH 11346]|uniref:Uncharacterized protein n=1 Tax=Ophiostoma piceae (strain UAMH 11346) TaxID=1262450 RepID=S3DBI2_OPHP1|nr:hypothetical protein F503_06025 [Ophiostoma piceae UAMH 11346]